MAARVESQAGGTDDGVATSVPSAFKNKPMLGVTEAIMWIACRRHFSHETIREHLERRARNLRRHTGSKEKPCLQVSPALSNRVDKAEFLLFRLIIGGVPAIGTLDDEGDPKHQKRVLVPVEFLKDGAYVELLSGHIRVNPLLDKHSGYQRPTYRDVDIDRDAFFKALTAAEAVGMPRKTADDLLARIRKYEIPSIPGQFSEGAPEDSAPDKVKREFEEKRALLIIKHDTENAEHEAAFDAPGEKTHQPPDSATSTAKKSQGGRPTFETEIRAAYDDLVESKKIIHPTTKVAAYPIVRNRVSELFRDKVKKFKGKGLGDEAIRKWIKAQFDKNEAEASPPKASP